MDACGPYTRSKHGVRLGGVAYALALPWTRVPTADPSILVRIHERDEPTCESPTKQSDRAMYTRLCQQPFAVTCRGLETDSKPSGNLFARTSVTDQLKNLQFASRRWKPPGACRGISWRWMMPCVLCANNHCLMHKGPSSSCSCCDYYRSILLALRWRASIP